MNKKWRKKILILSASLVIGIAAFVYFAGSVQSSKYDYTKLEMLPRFSAKEFCSCLFVVGQTEDYCREYINPKFNLGGLTIKLSWLVSTFVESNTTKKLTRSQVLGWYTAKAQYDPEQGCRLVF